MKIFLKVIVIALLLSLPRGLLFSINIKLLKGTHTILEGEDQFYAPFWGLAFIEEGVAEDLYDLSAKQIKKNVEHIVNSQTDNSISEQTNPLLLKYFEGKKNTATQNLVEQMFYKAAGTFTITNAQNNPVRLLMARKIGILLRKIKYFIWYSNHVKTIDENLFSKMLHDFDIVNKDIKKDFSDFKSDRASYIDLIFDQSLKNELSSVLNKSKVWNQFLASIKLSLKECDPLDPHALYPPNTTQGILLGYMLQKIESRKDIVSYLEGFLGKTVTLADDQYHLEDMNRIVANSVNFSSVVEFGDFICSSIYLKNYEGDLPKMAINKKIKYEGIEFTDCVENALRNFCNIVTYDKKRKVFGSNIALSEQLAAFYNIGLHKDASEISNIATHQAWMELLQNIPGVKYVQIKSKDSSSSVHVMIDEFDEKEDFEGFIPMLNVDRSLPKKVVNIDGREFTFYKKQMFGKIFLLVPQELGLHCFEVHAKLSNIIVLLQYLFNVAIYKKESEILQNDFAEKYFVLICEKLGLQVEDGAWKQRDILIDINLLKDDNRFVLQFKSIHADVFVPSEKKVMPTLPAKNLYGQYPAQIATYVSMYNVDINQLQNLVNSNPIALSQLISFVDVRSNDAKLFMVNDIVGNMATSLHGFMDSVLQAISNFSDQKNALDFFVNYIQNVSNLNMVQVFVPSYIAMINSIKLQNRKAEKELSLYESFLQLLLVQNDESYESFANNLEIVLDSDQVDAVKRGLFMMKLVLHHKLIPLAKLPLVFKPIVFCLKNRDASVFQDAVALLFTLVKSEAVGQEDMVVFMLKFAKYCIINLNESLPAINIISLLINARIIKSNSFDQVKVNKNKTEQAGDLIKIIDMSLSKLLTIPVRAKTTAQEVVD